MKPDKRIVEIITDQIIDLINPEKIILFGSFARGEITENSDIDLLIIIREGTHKRKTAQLLYRKIESYGCPFDLIIATIKDIENHKDNIGLIYKSILEHGKEIYAA